MADMTSSSSTPTQNPAARSSRWTAPAGWDSGWTAEAGKLDRCIVKNDMDRTTTIVMNKAMMTDAERQSRRTLNALDLVGPPNVKFDGELTQKPKLKTTQHQKNAIKNKLLGRE